MKIPDNIDYNTLIGIPIYRDSWDKGDYFIAEKYDDGLVSLIGTTYTKKGSIPNDIWSARHTYIIPWYYYINWDKELDNI